MEAQNRERRESHLNYLKGKECDSKSMTSTHAQHDQLLFKDAQIKWESIYDFFDRFLTLTDPGFSDTFRTIVYSSRDSEISDERHELLVARCQCIAKIQDSLAREGIPKEYTVTEIRQELSENAEPNKYQEHFCIGNLTLEAQLKQLDEQIMGLNVQKVVATSQESILLKASKQVVTVLNIIDQQLEQAVREMLCE